MALASRVRLAGEAFCFMTTRLLPIHLSPDGFGVELIAKRADPAFYLDVTGHESEPAAFLDLIA
jgi:hypothetical protein